MKTKVLLSGIFCLLCLESNAQNVVERFYTDNQTMVIAAGIFLLVCLVCYIIARVKSKKGQMILTANGWDKALLLISPVCLFISWFWGFDHEPNSIQTVLFVAAGTCFAGTLIFSAAYNSRNISGMLFSVFAKIFIVWLILVLLFLILLILIISIVITFMTKRDEGDEYILLKYDKTLDAFIGYRYKV